MLEMSRVSADVNLPLSKPLPSLPQCYILLPASYLSVHPHFSLHHTVYIVVIQLIMNICICLFIYLLIYMFVFIFHYLLLRSTAQLAASVMLSCFRKSSFPAAARPSGAEWRPVFILYCRGCSRYAGVAFCCVVFPELMMQTLKA